LGIIGDPRKRGEHGGIAPTNFYFSMVNTIYPFPFSLSQTDLWQTSQIVQAIKALTQKQLQIVLFT
jgi:ERCC4-type nuclease